MSVPPNASTAPSGAGVRGGIMSITIKDKSVLYSSYMPFIKNGGLFIPTNKPYKIGDEVFMLLTLLDEPEKLPVAGKIVWITPAGEQHNRIQGVGIQFGEPDSLIKHKIEQHLAGALGMDRPTYTI